MAGFVGDTWYFGGGVGSAGSQMKTKAKAMSPSQGLADERVDEFWTSHLIHAIPSDCWAIIIAKVPPWVRRHLIARLDVSDNLEQDTRLMLWHHHYNLDLYRREAAMIKESIKQREDKLTALRKQYASCLSEIRCQEVKAALEG